MSDRSLILIGGPDTGKTNYLARFWEAARSRKGALVAPALPGDVKYVENALAHLLQGEFAPRSDTNFEESNSFTLPVIGFNQSPSDDPAKIIVPDASGELWAKAVDQSELPPDWMKRLRSASGALLFVRVGSDQNRAPLDWVVSAQLLSFLDMAANQADSGEAGGVEADSEGKQPVIDPGVPTQVMLCELIRFLEIALGKDLDGVRPRLAIVVTAWDCIDQVRASLGPRRYIADEFPLLDGRLDDIDTMDVGIFGVSVVGGDFVEEAFRESFFAGDLNDAGSVIVETDRGVKMLHDLTVPVAWVLGFPIDRK